MASPPASRRRVSVHPHGRGDNWSGSRSRRRRRGSPPRAWGQFTRHPYRARAARFTPTGVGTIASDIVSQRHKAVHPHGRGDNQSSARARSSIYGSPPRAWGQCFVWRRCVLIARFTPTGVGTMSRTNTPTTRLTVHPHGRGDNARIARNIRSAYWFTPTGVGTIHSRFAHRVVTTVHPHGRGDN